jgi:rhodanese-related sulfurtransferase
MLEIEVSELQKHIVLGNKVVDVRESDEFAQGHIPGAINIALSTLTENIDAFRESETVFVVCQVGGRSGKACDYLRDLGIENVVNVAGGTSGWLLLGLPIETGDL